MEEHLSSSSSLSAAAIPEEELCRARKRRRPVNSNFLIYDDSPTIKEVVVGNRDDIVLSDSATSTINSIATTSTTTSNAIKTIKTASEADVGVGHNQDNDHVCVNDKIMTVPTIHWCDIVSTTTTRNTNKTTITGRNNSKEEEEEEEEDDDDDDQRDVITEAFQKYQAVFLPRYNFHQKKNENKGDDKSGNNNDNNNNDGNKKASLPTPAAAVAVAVGRRRWNFHNYSSIKPLSSASTVLHLPTKILLLPYFFFCYETTKLFFVGMDDALRMKMKETGRESKMHASSTMYDRPRRQARSE